MARLTWDENLSRTTWTAVRAEINTAREWHVAQSQAQVSDLIVASSDAYASEVDRVIDELRGPAPTVRFVAGTLEHLRDYLTWLNWVGWRVARLAPLQKEALDVAARRLAQAALAYAGGRLVDDGLDAHIDFKQHRRTLVGHLIAGDSPMPLQRACAESVFLGLVSYQRAVRRMRETDESDFAHVVERLFTKIAHGVLAEIHAPPVLCASEYDAIVRRKAVAYNMILNRAALWRCEAVSRAPLLRILYRMDEMAQLINDSKDEADDRSRSQVNAVASRVVTREQLHSIVRSGVVGIWQRTTTLGPTARGVVAAMLEELHLEAIEDDEQLRPRLSVVAHARSSLDQMSSAFRDGLWNLRTFQRLTGEFPTYHSTRPNMAQPVYHASPFVTAFVLLAVSGIVGHTDPLCRRAATQLDSWRDANGFVRFLATGIAADLDDTALINWALQKSGSAAYDFPAVAQRLAALPRRDGLYLTWHRAVDDADNDVDPCVTANVLRFVAPHGERVEEAARALGDALDDPRFREGTTYYVSPVTLPYLVSTLPRSVMAYLGGPDDWARRSEALLERWARGELASILDAAMLVSTACAVGVADERLGPIVDVLLGAQESDGRWPACAMFRAFNFWGASALSTALAVEALHGLLTKAGAVPDAGLDSPSQ